MEALKINGEEGGAKKEPIGDKQDQQQQKTTASPIDIPAALAASAQKQTLTSFPGPPWTPSPLSDHDQFLPPFEHLTPPKSQTHKHLRQSFDLRRSAKSLTKLNLTWTDPPKTVLVVKKYRDPEVAELTKQLLVWLVEEMGLTVYLEQSALEEENPPLPDHIHSEKQDLDRIYDNIRVWHPATDASFKCAEGENGAKIQSPDDMIDFIIILGGDGTVLHVCSLFQTVVPPIVSFNLGSLGFLTVFDYADHRKVIKKVVEGKAKINFRMRLHCSLRISPQSQEDSSSEDLLGSPSKSLEQLPSYDPSTPIEGGTEVHVQALNEIVIERGTSPFMTHLEMYVDGQKVTTVHADGLIIATPTGSTAYSLSAGGPIIHPSVPGILVTPICPHTLSFRPLFLPDSAELVIVNPPQSRQVAWVSADGRSRMELRHGDSIRICGSTWPVPTLSMADPSADLFHSLSRCLNWNVRETQKPLQTLTSSTSNSNLAGYPDGKRENDLRLLEKLTKKISQRSLSRVGS